MKRTIRGILLAAGLCDFAACKRDPDGADHSTWAREPGEPAGPRVTMEDDTVPLLTPEKVRQIAFAAITNGHPGLSNYVCRTIYFGGRSTNEMLRGNWLVQIGPTNPSPDFDFVISVDDSTGKAEVFRR